MEGGGVVEKGAERRRGGGIFFVVGGGEQEGRKGGGWGGGGGKKWGAEGRKRHAQKAGSSINSRFAENVLSPQSVIEPDTQSRFQRIERLISGAERGEAWAVAQHHRWEAGDAQRGRECEIRAGPSATSGAR